ncbi:glycosyltransferase family 39 protein [Patescibacteria group bacterium]|nr:glycosyltransferase family 39 protein [Patescibacteria group bacterium]
MLNKIKNIYKTHRCEFFLFFLALLMQLVVLALYILARRTGDFFPVDSDDYLIMARNIFFKHEFSITDLGPDATRPPLYPLMIVATYYLLAPKIWLTIIVQNLFAALNVVLVYQIAKILFSQFKATAYSIIKNKLSFVASLMFLFESERIQTAHTIMSDTLFVFLLLLSIFYFLKWIFENKNYKNIIFSGCFLGLATLTKPVSQALPLVFIICMGLYLIVDKGDIKRKIKKYGLSALLLSFVFILIIAPWSIRNKYRFETFKISPLAGLNLWELRVNEWKYSRDIKAGMNYAEATKSREANFLDAVQKIRIQYFPNMPNLISPETLEPDTYLVRRVIYSFPADKFFVRESYKRISEHPFDFLGFTVKGVARFFITPASAFILERITVPLLSIPHIVFFPYLFWAGRIVWLFYYAAIVMGLCLYQKRRTNEIWILGFLFALISYFALFGSMGHVTRFRLPVNPFIFILFLYCFYLFWIKLKKNFAAQRM